MNKTEESDKRWEGGGKICLKAYQKSGVTVILFSHPLKSAHLRDIARKQYLADSFNK